MENATSYLTILPGREDEINAFVEKVSNEINEGMYDPLKIWVKLNAIKRAISLIEENIKDSAIREREKYGKESNLFGCKITLTEAGTKYDYSGCNDSTLEMLEQKAEVLKKEIKKRQQFLKSIPKDKQFVDPETGEILIAPVKMSSTTIKIEKYDETN
jgi:hypothetical protein